MHGNVCANRDSEESIIDIKNGAEKNFRIIFYIIIGNVEKSKKVIRNKCRSTDDMGNTVGRNIKMVD